MKRKFSIAGIFVVAEKEETERARWILEYVTVKAKECRSANHGNTIHSLSVAKIGIRFQLKDSGGRSDSAVFLLRGGRGYHAAAVGVAGVFS